VLASCRGYSSNSRETGSSIFFPMIERELRQRKWEKHIVYPLGKSEYVCKKENSTFGQTYNNAKE
ncbi:MAG: hypothetical protein ACPH9Q_08700, partial [Schleiferiaceae bacterium]